MSISRPVIAGVDGSPAGDAAARYAARLAARRSGDLRLIHVRRHPLPGYTMTGFLTPEDPAATRVHDDDEQALRAVIARIRAETPMLADVRGEITVGEPAAVLVERAREAELTVVGTRGRGGFPDLRLGGVAVQVATHAPGIVVVVPPGERDVSDLAGGPVSVGYDGSPGAERALRAAAVEASLRDVVLDVVRFYDPLIDRAGEDAAQSVTVAAKILAEEFPALRVEARAPLGDHPGHALVETTRTAGLTVVGSRGRGGFAGLLLGSVGRTLLQHAEGPVAVVHPAI